MYHNLTTLWIELLNQGLSEDGNPWDWTTLGTRKASNPQIEAKLIAKSSGVWAAQTLVETLGKVYSDVNARSRVLDGAKFKDGETVAELHGRADSLLALERPFLNLAAYVSGIATQTQQYVEVVQNAFVQNASKLKNNLEPVPRVTLTRKTLPGYRDLAIHGVRLGGGHPHRVNLASGVLIKENHIATAGGIREAIFGVRGVAPHGLKIEIEVQNQAELETALQAGVDGVLLDNFQPLAVALAVRYSKEKFPGVYIEVSGGLTLDTIGSYSIPGVNILSVGSLTHSVKSVDLSFLIL